MEKTHRARKRFGQNFLKDQHIINTIVAAAELQAGDRVVEIGPGQGALTHLILPQVSEMHIIEIDRDLAHTWDSLEPPGLHVHTGDALRLDWTTLLKNPPYKLIANLPYNISTQVLFKIIDQREYFSTLVLMFQKEVAERLRARAGSKEYGALTVLCQLWFDVGSIVTVGPQAFVPRPKVTSEVLRFKRRDNPKINIDNPDFFTRVVKAAFAQRRKTLRNTLQNQGFDASSVESAAQAIGLDLKRRGETLDIYEFGALVQALQRFA